MVGGHGLSIQWNADSECTSPTGRQITPKWRRVKHLFDDPDFDDQDVGQEGQATPKASPEPMLFESQTPNAMDQEPDSIGGIDYDAIEAEMDLIDGDEHERAEVENLYER